MWIKFLKDLLIEGKQKIPAGSVLWCRRAAVIKQRHDGAWYQHCSIQTIETNELVLVLDDNAEGDLYEPCDEPAPGHKRDVAIPA